MGRLWRRWWRTREYGKMMENWRIWVDDGKLEMWKNDGELEKMAR
jgi:hypothetical protein